MQIERDTNFSVMLGGIWYRDIRSLLHFVGDGFLTLVLYREKLSLKIEN